MKQKQIKTLIHLSKGELAPHLFPLETMQSIIKKRQ